MLHRIALQLTRLYPLYKGRGRLALSPFLRGQAADTTAVIQVALASGEKINVIEHDYIGRMVRFFGDLDPAISKVMRSILRPGDVVVDIGANVGILTLQAASMVGETGHVFAFEPVRRLSGLLLSSVAQNQFNNVTVLEIALSDQSGIGSMQVAANSLGCSSLSADGQGEPCKLLRLDEMHFGRQFKRPRLVKIDVEGHESEVLRGGDRFFREQSPDYVLFESHNGRGDFWARPEITFLRDHGYEFSVVYRNALGNPRLRKVVAEDVRFPGAYDYLAEKRRDSESPH